MSSNPLTDSVVSKLSPQRGQTEWREVSDGGCRGLYLWISPRSEKVWGLRVVVNGKRRRHTIGAYPKVSLAEARRRALEYRAAIRDGESPESVDARLLAMRMTVSQAHAEYLRVVGPALRERTIYTKTHLFQAHIEPLLGGRMLRTIRRADVVGLVSAVSGKGFGVQATRAFTEMMAFLRWCEEREYVDGIPAIRKKEMRKHGAAKETPRQRVLSDEEVAELWQKSGNLGSGTRDLVRLLLLTGQRRDEVRLMSWEEIDMRKALWVIPKERYKTRVDHAVPLSPQVMAILKPLWSKGARGYVLTGRKDGAPFSGQASALRRLQVSMGDYSPFTLHDLRRTVRTGLSKLGVDSETAERVIGHLPEGMQRVYDMHDRLPERRRALQCWAQFVSSLNVVETLTPPEPPTRLS